MIDLKPHNKKTVKEITHTGRCHKCYFFKLLSISFMYIVFAIITACTVLPIAIRLIALGFIAGSVFYNLHKFRSEINGTQGKLSKWKEKAKSKFNHFRFLCQVKMNMFLGYIDKDGEPLKCYYCKSADLEECNHDYLDETYHGTVLEFDCRCKKCGKITGHWAYGHWCLH